MSKQFNDVYCFYGAPIGRKADGYIETNLPHSVRLFRVRLSAGGYDDGGAYWGVRRYGQSLWCAIDVDGNRQFVDAPSRMCAALKLSVGALALKVRRLRMDSDAVSYGLAMLESLAPLPEGVTRADVCRWLGNSGAAMGQETARVVGPNGRKSRRYPVAMARMLAAEKGDNYGVIE